jgi:hypothetical protein
VPQRRDGVLHDALKPARSGRRFRGGLDGRKMVLDPEAESAGLERVGEDERRRALHGLLNNGRLRAAALGEEAHAAAVARHQRSLGRSHRHVEIALCMFAVDPQRPGKPDRHLRDADEIFDISR